MALKIATFCYINIMRVNGCARHTYQFSLGVIADALFGIALFMLRFSSLGLVCIHRCNNAARTIYHFIGNLLVDVFIGLNHLSADLGSSLFADLFGDIAVRLQGLQNKGEAVIFTSVSRFVIRKLTSLGWEIQND